MTAPIRVLLVDDQELIRVGFRLVLDAEADIDVVGEAGDGEAAVDAVRRTRPDVVLMDVRMPRTDGIAATARIVAEMPTTRVLVLTTFDLDEYAFGALDAGASGFLLKDARRDELTAAVRAIHRGDAVLSPRVTRELISRASRLAPADSASRLVASLTERERDVFLAMGRGLTNAEIAASLFLGESTVKTHVGRILAKLGARDRVHAVILAHRSGLVGPADPLP
ncbi:response regulator transcription factor [Microbacterium aurum]|uniref:DNA-binding response regulator n=1 Tax=Microbacterium aurum TaxID=36805 RepID=A0A1P8U8G4_9MICO|nr:response regulator transcription factor [Microbacterium aurum]APZ34384.1 DNA-binding response regulator [Microbacterium aurum]MBM7828240.1 DNA-binding NarL/FixJ family response regulator [Microbacterium aurum]MCG7414188.1 response regulator transcription factor [Microbacterium aurum]